MKKSTLLKAMLPGALTLSVCLPANAAIELYNEGTTKASIDTSFNTFYVSTDTDNELSGNDRDQSRVKMGFLPNWVGFTFEKELNGLKLGGRSSFWISISDSDNSPTDGLVDTRQFYGTVDGDWGQILFGKDFTLFNRSNIFMDEILLGYGWVNDTVGLVDGGNVSFGNIGSGYIYPLPTAQITYRSPEINGFKLAVGLINPSRTSSGPDAEEDSPRIEAELTYNTKWQGGAFTGWVGGLQQNSKSSTSEVDSSGVSLGGRVKLGNVAFHASGYDGEGIGWLIGPSDSQGLGLGNLISENGNEVDSKGWLTQASYTHNAERFVVSYGKSEIENSDRWLNETKTVGWFHSFNDNFTGVVEYTMNELEIGGGTEEANTIALGLIVNF